MLPMEEEIREEGWEKWPGKVKGVPGVALKAVPSEGEFASGQHAPEPF